MPCLRASAWIRLAFGCLAAAPISASAQVVYFNDHADTRCLAVEKLPDGSWTTRRPVTFRRSVWVGTGAIIYRGTVIDGIDLGAVLDRQCGGDESAPAVRF